MPKVMEPHSRQTGCVNVSVSLISALSVTGPALEGSSQYINVRELDRRPGAAAAPAGKATASSANAAKRPRRRDMGCLFMEQWRAGRLRAPFGVAAAPWSPNVRRAGRGTFDVSGSAVAPFGRPADRLPASVVGCGAAAIPTHLPDPLEQLANYLSGSAAAPSNATEAHLPAAYWHEHCIR